MCVCDLYVTVYGIWKDKRIRSNNLALQTLSDNLDCLLYPVVHSHWCQTVLAMFSFKPKRRLCKYSLNKLGVNSWAQQIHYAE